jgi:hypothetical protein
MATVPAPKGAPSQSTHQCSYSSSKLISGSYIGIEALVSLPAARLSFRRLSLAKEPATDGTPSRQLYRFILLISAVIFALSPSPERYNRREDAPSGAGSVASDDSLKGAESGPTGCPLNARLQDIGIYSKLPH